MEPISILYHETFSEFSNLYQIEIRELSNKIERKINTQFSKGFDIVNKLASNPNYNFVVLHIGEGNGMLMARGCRRLSNALLVAESSIYPHGSEEVLQYFDEYIWHLMHEDCLENLLKKYGFISEQILESKEKAL
ncbi:hypothetical protein HYT92_01375 [Candidatus Pacearchaeota archaeon]|nr:hypothetical protein [Candidatus Pacearchaeota archaeon]